jgi:hypothetical protein
MFARLNVLMKLGTAIIPAMPEGLSLQNQTMMEAHLKDVLDQMTDLEV